jgi:hypothetical protein
MASAAADVPRHLQQSKRIREISSPLIQTLGDVLERGHREGVFRGGVDSVQLDISIAGHACFYLSNSHTLSTLFGRDLMSPKALSERLSLLMSLIGAMGSEAFTALARTLRAHFQAQGILDAH